MRHTLRKGHTRGNPGRKFTGPTVGKTGQAAGDSEGWTGVDHAEWERAKAKDMPKGIGQLGQGRVHRGVQLQQGLHLLFVIHIAIVLPQCAIEDLQRAVCAAARSRPAGLPKTAICICFPSAA